MFDADKLLQEWRPCLACRGVQVELGPLAPRRYRAAIREAGARQGGRVVYRGADINAWLESKTVEPTGAAA